MHPTSNIQHHITIMLTRLSLPENPRFRTTEEAQPLIREHCVAHPDIAQYLDIGHSEEGRPLYGAMLGKGPRMVSLLAGAHSDEPVGPETLRTLIVEGLHQQEKLAALFRRYRFLIVPHINPDGEARNQTWVRRWPDLEAYIGHTVREKPGRDVEFGYPEMRTENRLISTLLRRYAPYALHLSLHGMAFAEGAFLLIERHWIERTKTLRRKFSGYARQMGMTLHDHDRKGEKGFLYLGAGFTTTPEGEAMQRYFRDAGDEATAALFHLSSMEYVRTLGGDPLCLVTELPLFDIRGKMDGTAPGVPAAYLAWKALLPELQLKLAAGESIAESIAPFKVQPLDLAHAIRFQLHVIQLGLEAVEAAVSGTGEEYP